MVSRGKAMSIRIIYYMGYSYCWPSRGELRMCGSLKKYPSEEFDLRKDAKYNDTGLRLCLITLI